MTNKKNQKASDKKDQKTLKNLSKF